MFAKALVEKELDDFQRISFEAEEIVTNVDENDVSLDLPDVPMENLVKGNINKSAIDPEIED